MIEALLVFALGVCWLWFLSAACYDNWMQLQDLQDLQESHEDAIANAYLTHCRLENDIQRASRTCCLDDSMEDFEDVRGDR